MKLTELSTKLAKLKELKDVLNFTENQLSELRRESMKPNGFVPSELEIEIQQNKVQFLKDKINQLDTEVN